MKLRELLASVRQRHPDATPETILWEADIIGFEA